MLKLPCCVIYLLPRILCFLNAANMAIDRPRLNPINLPETSALDFDEQRSQLGMKHQRICRPCVLVRSTVWRTRFGEKKRGRVLPKALQESNHDTGMSLIADKPSRIESHLRVPRRPRKIGLPAHHFFRAPSINIVLCRNTAVGWRGFTGSLATHYNRFNTHAMKTLNAADLSPQENYKLLAGTILPRPIAFVSTQDQQGIRNLAPFSFFTVASANPPIVVFCPMVRPPNEKQLPSTKDTLSNIAATREFVLNIVSEDFVDKMNQAAAEVPSNVDEWELSGLTPVASELVRPPRVSESRMQMECRLLQLVVASDKPLGGTLVLGEVLRFHVAEAIIDDRYTIDPDKLHAVGRMAGASYIRTTDRFDLERPK